ncbi:MAG TPA: hypothetical protein VI854_00565 [Acidimicrobiia bacterium]|nr:hypothetical protein [Acidimicrobiia bacterium]
MEPTRLTSEQPALLAWGPAALVNLTDSAADAPWHDFVVDWATDPHPVATEARSEASV